MKSIHTKFLVLILSCVIISAAAFGGIGIYSAINISQTSSKEIINRICSENAQKINGVLYSIERSVNIAYNYALDGLDDIERIKTDAEYASAYIKDLKKILLNIAENTDGAVASYFRFSPEVAQSDVGLFLVKDDDTGVYEEYPPTVISNYEKDDVSHVGWYYIPIENGGPVWVEPYTNKNIGDVDMISYVIPIFINSEPIGVIGMDIDMELIKSYVNDVSAYETGFAFLCSSNGDIVYHKEYNGRVNKTDFFSRISENAHELSKLEADDSPQLLNTSSRDGELRKMTYSRLDNGMYLILTVPSAEIDATRNSLITLIMIFLAVILVAATAVTICVTRVIVKPIQQLTREAKKLASGDTDIYISHNSKDEVGDLVNSFNETSRRLTEYMEYINKQAYTDAATGVGNKTAYAEAVKRVELLMKHDNAKIGIAVLDINNLKKYNDKLGHEYGDMLISDSVEIIKKVYGNYDIYRIGGDEFAVIMIDFPDGECERLCDEFSECVDEFDRNSTKYEMGFRVAVGTAQYRPGVDRSTFISLFNRADKEMYQNKQATKEKYNASVSQQ